MNANDENTNAHKLSDEYSVSDYQSTPSGYYQITFRGDGEIVVVTQTGRGGCNYYSPSPRPASFDKWLDDNAWLAIAFYRRLGGDFMWLVSAIESRETEWEDHVVMGICDMIDLRLLTVKG